MILHYKAGTGQLQVETSQVFLFKQLHDCLKSSTVGSISTSHMTAFLHLVPVQEQAGAGSTSTLGSASDLREVDFKGVDGGEQGCCSACVIM